VKLIGAGQGPADAVHTGLAIGRYGWWPDWLLAIVGRPGAGRRLDQETIRPRPVRYAELSPAQARIARKLLGGDQGMIEASAARLETSASRRRPASCARAT